MKLQRITGDSCKESPDCGPSATSECIEGQCVCVAGTTVDFKTKECVISISMYNKNVIIKILVAMISF